MILTDGEMGGRCGYGRASLEKTTTKHLQVSITKYLSFK
jgi:hypothetical protein